MTRRHTLFGVAPSRGANAPARSLPHDSRYAIHTRADGTPIPRPERATFASDAEYVRAYHAWRDAITAEGNAAFDAAWRGR